MQSRCACRHVQISQCTSSLEISIFCNTERWLQEMKWAGNDWNQQTAAVAWNHCPAARNVLQFSTEKCIPRLELVFQFLFGWKQQEACFMNADLWRICGGSFCAGFSLTSFVSALRVWQWFFLENNRCLLFEGTVKLSAKYRPSRFVLQTRKQLLSQSKQAPQEKLQDLMWSYLYAYLHILLRFFFQRLEAQPVCTSTWGLVTYNERSQYC